MAEKKKDKKQKRSKTPKKQKRSKPRSSKKTKGRGTSGLTAFKDTSRSGLRKTGYVAPPRDYFAQLVNQQVQSRSIEEQNAAITEARRQASALQKEVANQRQTIEAGIKEGKQVFQMHHLKVRSPAGLVIQELFAAFAANFVRWAAVWLHEACVDLPPPLSAPQPSVKRLVRIAANTTAWVSWQPTGCLLRFTELSAFAGIQLIIKRSTPFQLALPFLESVDFSPI